MKFNQLLYGKDEGVFLFFTEHQIQHMIKLTVGRKFNQAELRYLKAKTTVEMSNLIIKIDATGTRP